MELTVDEMGTAAPLPSTAVEDGPAPTAGWPMQHRWTVATILTLLTIFALQGRVPADAILAAFLVLFVLLVDGLTTRGVAGTLAVARDWSPVVAILVIYDMTRGVADEVGMPLQVQALIRSEEFLFLGQVPTVWLQSHVLGATTAWWEAILAMTYVTHFMFSFVLLGVLYARSRTRWLRYLRRFVTLNIAGMVTYIVLPAAPPWWASQHGHLGAVERSLNRGWDTLGLHAIGSLIHKGQGGANDVAALPSLHAGYACLFAFFLWGAARRSKPLLAIYPVLMAFALVIGGEHYVVDLILGAIYAGAIHVAWTRWERRRAEERPGEPDSELEAALAD